MERLDACYFCGTATDAPLREVTISPRDRRGDPDASVRVTLCPSCEGKLERVLGGLFDHVESGAAATERTGADDRSAGPASGRAPDGEPAAGRDTPGGEADEAAPADDEPGGRVDRINVASSVDDVDAGEDDDRLFSEPPSVGDVEPGGERGADDEADEPGESAPGEDEGAEIVDDEPRVRARATSGGSNGLDGVSVAEYNRVMRLLQNREFPMARTAFVDLAGSAYDLGEDTVQAVLDAVIDQGALAEREGQLVKPDEEEDAGQP